MCIVVYYLLLYLAPNLWIREIFALLMIVALVAAFVTRESDKSSVEIILSKVGNKSLDIYIYHYILISMIHIETLGKWFVSSANPFIELMLVFMLSTIISAISIGIGIVVRKGVLLSNVIYGKWIK